MQGALKYERTLIRISLPHLPLDLISVCPIGHSLNRAYTTDNSRLSKAIIEISLTKSRKFYYKEFWRTIQTRVIGHTLYA